MRAYSLWREQAKGSLALLALTAFGVAAYRQTDAHFAVALICLAVCVLMYALAWGVVVATPSKVWWFNGLTVRSLRWADVRSFEVLEGARLAGLQRCRFLSIQTRDGGQHLLTGVALVRGNSSTPLARLATQLSEYLTVG